MGHGQAEHQGPEELALAGPGGADAEAVGAHAAVRRLLEVEQQRPAVGPHPDRGPQALPLPPPAPQRCGLVSPPGGRPPRPPRRAAPRWGPAGTPAAPAGATAW